MTSLLVGVLLLCCCLTYLSMYDDEDVPLLKDLKFLPEFIASVKTVALNFYGLKLFLKTVNEGK